MVDEDGGAPDAVADELYAVDPAEFVPKRAELVRQLRAEKQREAAAAVGKLRRPSPAAWAVNQLARRHRDELEGLVRLGDELRAAQDRALGGAGAAELRQAARDRRDAVAALTGAAARLLAERGGGVDAHLPGVTATLEAASLDAGAAATVLAGRLTAELEPPSGFGELPFDLPAVHRPEPPQPESEEPESEEPAEPERAAPDEVEQAERAVAEAARRADDLAAAARAVAARAVQRQRAVADAESEVAACRRRLDEAERRLADATSAAADVRQQVQDADAAAAGAVAELEQAQRRLEQARA